MTDDDLRRRVEELAIPTTDLGLANPVWDKAKVESMKSALLAVLDVVDRKGDGLSRAGLAVCVKGAIAREIWGAE